MCSDNERAFFKIKNLSFGYKSGFKIENINLNFRKGEFVGIIGPNGSGKTTLFRAVCGTQSLIAGNVYLDEIDLKLLSIKERAQVMAIVPQFMEVPYITVEDYVLMGRLPYRNSFHFFDKKEDIELAHHFMHLTNVYRFKNKLLSQLSGGERQMVAIAQALTQQPKILLLDEPTAHLDITHQIKLMNLIKCFNIELNLTVVMIIHDLSLACEYSDYLVLMCSGNVFDKGSPNNILNVENIKKVFGTDVLIQPNPISGKPMIFPLSSTTTGPA